MSAAPALALTLAALCACTVENRDVQVGRLCVGPPAGGVISDFSTARAGRCLAPMCTEALEGDPLVSLGVGGVRGLVYPYRKPASVGLTLAPTGDLLSARDPASALRVAVEYDSSNREPPPLVAGVALRLVDCVELSGHAGVSFRLGGELGACPLRFAARFAALGDDPTSAPCVLDECHAEATHAATLGVNTARVADAAKDRVFLGLQWELGVPADGARTCAADFTIDDVSLITGP